MLFFCYIFIDTKLVAVCICQLFSKGICCAMSGAIPELIAKWISGHGMPSSYLCLTPGEVGVAVSEHGSSVHSHRASVPMCRSLSVTSNPISSELTAHNSPSLSVACLSVLFVKLIFVLNVHTSCDQ